MFTHTVSNLGFEGTATCFFTEVHGDHSFSPLHTAPPYYRTLHRDYSALLTRVTRLP